MTDVRLSPRRRRARPSLRNRLASARSRFSRSASPSPRSSPTRVKSNRVYRDLAGIPTVCYGHIGSDVGSVGSTRTDPQCQALLTSDARAVMTVVLACTPMLADRPLSTRGGDPAGVQHRASSLLPLRAPLLRSVGATGARAAT